MKTTNILIRGIPTDLKARLKKNAEENRRSLSQEIIHELAANAPAGKRGLDLQKLEDLKAIVRETRKLPILDHRSENEILGYDEHGLPS